MTATLQSEFDALEPKLRALAENLGQSPETLLRETIEEKEREWAYQKLDEAVAEARASGFVPHVPGTLTDEVRKIVLQRRAKAEAA